MHAQSHLVATTVPSRIIDADLFAPAALECPRCAADLTLHQLDPMLPERLVAICGGCRRWFLIDLASGCRDGSMTEFPDPAHFRRAMGCACP